MLLLIIHSVSFISFYLFLFFLFLFSLNAESGLENLALFSRKSDLKGNKSNVFTALSLSLSLNFPPSRSQSQPVFYLSHSNFLSLLSHSLLSLSCGPMKPRSTPLPLEPVTFFLKPFWLEIWRRIGKSTFGRRFSTFST